MKTFSNIILLSAILLFGACSLKSGSEFVSIKNNQFMLNNQPNVELCVDILNNKIRRDGLHIPVDVISFIASTAIS